MMSAKTICRLAGKDLAHEEENAWLLFSRRSDAVTKTFKLVASSVLVATGVLLPMVFHMAGAAGSIFLPMHIPALLAGFLLGPYCGLCVGLLAPLLSSLSTGMPPVPVLPVMTVELAVYGAVGGWLYRDRKLSIWLSLIAAMTAGRLAAALSAYILVKLLAVKLNPLTFITGAVLTGLPGITVQLMLVPLLVRRLEATVRNK